MECYYNLDFWLQKTIMFRFKSSQIKLVSIYINKSIMLLAIYSIPLSYVFGIYR